MSDFASSLPIRTESNGDAAVKLVDGTITSRVLTINADGSLNITDNSGSLTVDGTVELGATTLAALESITVQNGAGASAVNIQDGGNSLTVDAVNLDIRDLAFATDKVDVTGSDVTATVSATDLDIRDLDAAQDNVAISDGSDTLEINADGSLNAVVTATDLDIRNLSHSQDSVKIGDGTDFLAVNTDGSINVVVSSDIAGAELCAYNTSAALAGGASVNFDYTVTAATTLLIDQAFTSGSGKIKTELKVETAVASGTYNTKFVGFNSTANPNIDMDVNRLLKQVAGAKVRVTITNRDNQAQDVYSTLSGTEI